MRKAISAAPRALAAMLVLSVASSPALAGGTEWRGVGHGGGSGRIAPRSTASRAGGGYGYAHAGTVGHGGYGYRAGGRGYGRGYRYGAGYGVGAGVAGFALGAALADGYGGGYYSAPAYVGDYGYAPDADQQAPYQSPYEDGAPPYADNGYPSPQVGYDAPRDQGPADAAQGYPCADSACGGYYAPQAPVSYPAYAPPQQVYVYRSPCGCGS